MRQGPTRLSTTLFVLLLMVLGSCTSKPVVSSTEIPLTTKRQFENRIAGHILQEVRDQLPALQGRARVHLLREKSEQLRRSIDQNLLGSRLKNELLLLDYLRRSEETFLSSPLDAPETPVSRHQLSTSYPDLLQALSSLDWTPKVYEQKIQAEISRLDQTIAVLADQSIREGFDIRTHMSTIRAGARYPEDSVNGRQDYLDELLKEMLNAQADWFDVYETYNASELSLLGEEGTTNTFRYSTEGLSINLDEVTDLPAFEQKSIAVYYGFPGLQSFSTSTPGTLKSFLTLPAYTHGWAAYMLDEIGIRDSGNTITYLYFSRLLASLALADLRMHQGIWTLDDALTHIWTHTPYHRHRINLMLNEVKQNPGVYAAALAGKLRFASLHSRCLQAGGACQAEFNQQIIDLGPVPFELLEHQLFR